MQVVQICWCVSATSAVKTSIGSDTPENIDQFDVNGEI